MHSTTLTGKSLFYVIQEITKNKSLSLLIILISQTHNVSDYDKNYHYYYSISMHDEAVYNTIQNTQKKNIQYLLKLWLKELTYKILDEPQISPEDKKIIDRQIDEAVKNKKKKHELSIENIKNYVFQEFVTNISKSNLDKTLKSQIQKISDNMLLYFNKYHNEVINEIVSGIHDPDAISLLACHGILINNVPPANRPISEEIKQVYINTMRMNPADIHPQNIFNKLPERHIARTIWEIIDSANTKLTKKQNNIEKFSVAKYPWYSIINNIKKMINNSIFVKQRLEKERLYLNKIRSHFTESIKYGDTALFFKEIEKISKNMTNSWSILHINTNALIKSLTDLKPEEGYQTLRNFAYEIQHYDSTKGMSIMQPTIEPQVVSSFPAKEKVSLKKQINKTLVHTCPKKLKKLKSNISKSAKKTALTISNAFDSITSPRAFKKLHKIPTGELDNARHETIAEASQNSR